MAIGIDPTVDFAFKKLFGSPEHPDITIHFLNAVLRDNPRIVDIEILNPFLERDFADDRLAILDVLARDETGRVFNIEMQTTLPSELPERLAYYVSSLFVGQIGRGDSYNELRPAIGICVLDGLLLPNSPQILHDFRLRCGDITLSDCLQIHLLELPKYRLPSDNKRVTDPIEAWAYFLRQVQHLTAEQVADQLADSPFIEAAGILEMIARTPKERDLYEARLKLQRDEEARLRYAKNQGLTEGIELGREEGLEKGREQGREQGKLAGSVQTLQELLGEEISADKELLGMNFDSLATLIQQLQQKLRDRNV